MLNHAACLGPQRRLPDVVWPAAAERQPRARRGGYISNVKLGRNVRQRGAPEDYRFAAAGPNNVRQVKT